MNWRDGIIIPTNRQDKPSKRVVELFIVQQERIKDWANAPYVPCAVRTNVAHHRGYPSTAPENEGVTKEKGSAVRTWSKENWRDIIKLLTNR